MHKIQKIILKRLIDKNRQRYNQLVKDYTSDDNINYHLNKLLDLGLIQKRSRYYFITRSGLKVSGEYSLDDLEEKKYKTLYIGFVCFYKDKYILRGRKSGSCQFYKLPGGKPVYGKPHYDEVERLFAKATSLKLPKKRFTHDSIHFKLQLTSQGKILFDDTLIVYKVKLTEGEYHKAVLRKNNYWFSKKQIRNLKHRWPEINMCILRKNWKPICEYSFVSDYIIDSKDL